MKKTLVSVVIPTYNRCDLICRTIDSVLKQTYKNIEVLVIDDGSSDKTKQVVTKIYKGLVNYQYKKNEGVQIARNTGLLLSKGEYVLFLDSDDTLYPTYIEKAVYEFQKDDEVGAVYCLTGLIQEDGTVKAARDDRLEGNCFKEVLIQGYLTSTSFIIFKRSLFAKIGIWDITFPASQDDDMCFRVAKYSKIKLIPEILGIFHIDASEHIGGSQKRVALGWWTLWKKYTNDILQNCGKKILLAKYKDSYKRFIQINEISMVKEVERKIKKEFSYFGYNLFKTELFRERVNTKLRDLFAKMKKLVKKIIHR